MRADPRARSIARARDFRLFGAAENLRLVWRLRIERVGNIHQVARLIEQESALTTIVFPLGLLRELDGAGAVCESSADVMIDKAGHAIELAWEAFCGHSADTECAFFSGCRSAFLIV